MPERVASGKVTAIRGPVLTYTGDPFKSGLEHTMVYESDAIVAMADGKITHFGPADRIRPQLPTGHRDQELRQGLADLRGLHRQPRPLSANADDRGLRRAAAGLAQQIHLSDRAEILRQGICPLRREGLSARESAQRHHLRLRLLHRLSAIGRCAVRGSREARHAPRGRQGDDGPQRAGKAARHAQDRLRRFQGADQEMAQSRTADVRDHAAVRADQHARATGSDRRALQGASRSATCRRTFPRTRARSPG